MARSYEQHCGLAVALDVTSSRWAMLIVRDLEPGPRRFTDLFDGLPGISTDMLATRLRALTTAGAVTRRNVSSPVPGQVYELTERGHELASIGHDLARWGMPLLPPLKDSPLRLHARWALQSMTGNATGNDQRTIIHFTIDDADQLTLTSDADGARLAYGHLDTADITIDITSRAFFTLRANILKGRNSVPANAHVDGSIERLADVFSTMPLVRSEQI